MAGFWDNFGKALNAALWRKPTTSIVGLPGGRVSVGRAPSVAQASSWFSGGGGSKRSPAPNTGININMPGGNRPTPQTLDELLARYLQQSGGGYYGGGGGGGRGGGGGYGAAVAANNAARDAAKSRASKTYGGLEKHLKGNIPKYKKIGAEEKKSGADSAAKARAGANESYGASTQDRDAQRRALGIEAAAKVINDSLAQGKERALSNIDRIESRTANRAKGHLDSTVKFANDFRAVVGMEGAELQQRITDFYANQLAQLASRARGGGRGGGGRRYGGGGGGMSVSNAIQMAKAAQFEQARQYDSRYWMTDFLNVYNQLPSTMSDSNKRQLTKDLIGKYPYG